MNKLEKLIAKLCPNGVEYKPLGEIVDIDKGVQLNRNSLSSDGEYPVINGGINPSGYWDEYNFEKDLITVSQGGASAGYVNWISTPFWAGAHCFVLTNPKPGVLYRYVYFVVKATERELMQSQIGAGIPSVSVAKLSNVSVPLPPLPVQHEIVRMLDDMAGLIGELEQELAARKQQYEWYRDKLLKLTGGYRKVTLGEVVEVLDNMRVPVSKQNRKSGPYPYYGANGVQDYVDSYILDGVFLLVGEDGSVIRSDGSPVLNWAVGKIWVNNHAHILMATMDADLRYLFYALQTTDVSSLVRGTPPKLNQENLKKIELMLPPLADQKKIVARLDAFDKLCNSMTEGLPGEIAARKQQYEYYRDKLLTFKKAG